MTDFIRDNAGTAVFAALLLTALFFAIRRMIKNRKKGSCCMDCSSCGKACPMAEPDLRPKAAAEIKEQQIKTKNNKE